MAENTKKSSVASILLAWLLVAAPLGWGVYNTLLDSMKLFQAHSGNSPDKAATEILPSRYKALPLSSQSREEDTFCKSDWRFE
jgi:hypothetical protein